MRIVLFIAGIGFIIRGFIGEYPLAPFILIGVILLAAGVWSIFRKPKPKKSEFEAIRDDIRNNKPIKL